MDASSGSRHRPTRLAVGSLKAAGCQMIFCHSADCHTGGPPFRRRGTYLPPLALIVRSPS